MLEFDFIQLFALLPLPLLLRFVFPAHREPRLAVSVPFLDRLARLTGQTPQRGAVIPGATFGQRFLGFVSWGLILTALARPQWVEKPITKTMPTRDLLLAVDLSGSMEAEDFTDPDGNRIDRLTAVKQVLDGFLARREGDRVGLIFFGSAAFVQAPFTSDLAVVRSLMDEAQVRMAGPQTMLGDAIGLALKVFEESQTEERVLIVLTDGNDTGSQMPPPKAAEIARDRKITIHTVAVGDPLSVGEEKLDTETLKTMAQTTGGRFFQAMDRAQLGEIYDQLDALETRKIETLTHRPKRDLFFYPLGAFFVLGLGFHLTRLLRQPSTAGSSAKVSGRQWAWTVWMCFTVAVGGLLLYGWLSADGMRFHFIRPRWLAGLAVSALLLWFVRAHQDRLRQWQGVIADHLLPYLTVGQEKAAGLRPWHLLAILWGMTVIALAGPTWRQQPSPFMQDKAALFIVMKVAPSMQARDIQPSRQERAVHKVRDLLALRPGAQNGLIAYAGSAHLVMPLTRDAAIINTFAAALSPEIMPAEGDALADALILAGERLRQAGVPGSILVIADAVPEAQAKRLAEIARDIGYDAHILAVASPTPGGSPPGPALDRKGLDQAAGLLGGSLTVVTADDADVKRIAARIARDLQASPIVQEGQRWQDFGYWLVPLVAFLSLMWFRPGWVVRYD